MFIFLIVAAVGGVGYAAYKHVTVAQVKADLVTWQADVVKAEQSAAAEAQVVWTAVKTKLASLVASHFGL